MNLVSEALDRRLKRLSTNLSAQDAEAFRDRLVNYEYEVTKQLLEWIDSTHPRIEAPK
jgi:hypothetical protein